MHIYLLFNPLISHFFCYIFLPRSIHVDAVFLDYYLFHTFISSTHLLFPSACLYHHIFPPSPLCCCCLICLTPFLSPSTPSCSPAFHLQATIASFSHYFPQCLLFQTSFAPTITSTALTKDSRLSLPIVSATEENAVSIDTFMMGKFWEHPV